MGLGPNLALTFTYRASNMFRGWNLVYFCALFCWNEGHVIIWTLAKNNSGDAYLILRYMVVEIYPNMTVYTVRPKSCLDFFLQSSVFGSFTMCLNGVSIYWCYTYRGPNVGHTFSDIWCNFRANGAFLSTKLAYVYLIQVFNDKLFLNYNIRYKFLHSKGPGIALKWILWNIALK